MGCSLSVKIAYGVILPETDELSLGDLPEYLREFVNFSTPDYPYVGGEYDFYEALAEAHKGVQVIESGVHGEAWGRALVVGEVHWSWGMERLPRLVDPLTEELVSLAAAIADLGLEDVDDGWLVVASYG